MVDEEKERQIREARKCTLCLEEWTDPTVTECGHVFCWSCIVGWSGEKVRLSLFCLEKDSPTRPDERRLTPPFLLLLRSNRLNARCVDKA